jgi:Myb/SANT-like DNA-binding domain
MSASADQAASDSGTEATGKKVEWSPDDETLLIQFLIEHKAEAGDGTNYKKSLWTQIAATLNACKTSGASKTESKCKSKWGRVRIKFIHIYALD